MRHSATGWTEGLIGRSRFAIVLFVLASGLASAQETPQAQPLPPPPPPTERVEQPVQEPAPGEVPLQPQIPVLPLPQPIEFEESTRWSKTLERISSGVVAITIEIAASITPPTMKATGGRFGSWLPVRPRITPAAITGRNEMLDTIAVRRGLDGTTSARMNTLKPAKISDV